MGKATMQEIAEQCGVSLKTVSRVINHSEAVSESTRQRVEQAMESLGYRVNLLARGLKQSQTNIVVVFLDRHQEEYLNAWRNQMLQALFQYTREIGLRLIVAPSDSQGFQNDETDGFNLLASGIADGAILMEYYAADSRLEYLQKNQLPYVILGQTEDPGLHAVSLDHYQLGYQGGQYLASRGCRRICLIPEAAEVLSANLCIRGFMEALEGQEAEGVISSPAKTPDDAYRQACQMLSARPPDSFFVSGDERAAAVYRAIREEGLEIPGQVGVLGFSDLPIGSVLCPPLTAFRQDFSCLARAVAERLSAQQKDEPIPGNVFYPSVLIERDSIK